MKILVAIRQVADYAGRLLVKTDGSGVESLGARAIINPFDEVALERAVRLRESGLASEVVVVTCGPPDCERTLRSALAVGADRAILVESVTELQPLPVAKCLHAIVVMESPNLVLCGTQSVDENSGQVPQMLAALGGWPQALCACEITFHGATALVTCEVDSGLEQLEISLPGVVSAGLRLSEPRHATMIGIVQAKKKPLRKTTPTELNVDTGAGISTVHVSPRRGRFQEEVPSLPPFPWLWSRVKRSQPLRVSNVTELVAKLRDEARAI